MISAIEFAGIARALASALGGYLVGKGLVDTETATALGGAAVTILVAVWSVIAKRKAS
jgi:hypothetical protein